jgi:hypothetical protein
MLTARVAPKDPVGDHDVAGARVLAHHGGQDADRSSPGHQHVLAEHREGQCGVDGVAKWIKDRRHFGRDQFPVHPDVRGRQRYVLREGAVEMNADPPGVDA